MKKRQSLYATTAIIKTRFIVSKVQVYARKTSDWKNIAPAVIRQWIALNRFVFWSLVASVKRIKNKSHPRKTGSGS
jgi:hypothetical protein